MGISEAYRLIPSVCVALVVTRGSRVLILRKVERPGIAWGGHWCLPGGRLNYGESILDCCVRELAEETGIITHKYNLKFELYTELVSEFMHLVGFVYRVDGVSDEPENREPDKHDAMGFFPWHRLPRPLHLGLCDVARFYGIPIDS